MNFPSLDGKEDGRYEEADVDEDELALEGKVEVVDDRFSVDDDDEEDDDEEDADGFLLESLCLFFIKVSLLFSTRSALFSSPPSSFLTSLIIEER